MSTSDYSNAKENLRRYMPQLFNNGCNSSNLMLEDSDEEEINLRYIIKNKPKPSVVREYYKCIIDQINEDHNERAEEILNKFDKY